MRLFRNLKLEIRNYPNGFTLIEILVVVSIMTMLSGFMIVYTRGSENQIKILKDKAVFVGALYRARSLALRTLTSSEEKVCGYGLYMVDRDHFVVWRDLSSSASCADANGVYDGATENFEIPLSLSKNIIFANESDSNFLKSILFIPPNPEVVVAPVLMPGSEYKIVIGTVDGKFSATMGVNKLGQVRSVVGY